jgi:hypothetical protein
MPLEFKRINKDGDDFELLCRDVLEDLGAKILSAPSRGPDGKKDLLIEIQNKDLIGRLESTVYLVQCKHKAHSGKSVLETDIGDFRSACDNFNAKGYFLITSTFPSTTVNNSLEATNGKGIYKTQIWDKKLLEAKIEECPNGKRIIKRYNLIDDIDILVKYTKKIIDGHENIPFTYKQQIDLLVGKALIYEEKNQFEDENFEFKEVITRHGFVCIVEALENGQIVKINKTINCQRIIYISEDTIDSIDSITLNELNNELGQYKDIWYQARLIHFGENVAIDPFLIKLIEIFYKDSPYRPQQESLNFFKLILNVKIDEKIHPVLLTEVLAVIEKNELTVLFPDILNLLDNILNSGMQDLHKTIVTQKIFHVLGKLDKDNSLLNVIENIYDKSDWIQLKVNCLEYYSLRKSDHIKDKVKALVEQSKNKSVLPKHHLIGYNFNKIQIVRNQINWPVSKYVEDYLKSIIEINST